MRSRSCLRAVALTTTLSLGLPAIAPTLAFAAAKEIDVTLKNGAMYHGKLVEKVPGDHVTIELATGEVKRFEWDDLTDEEQEPAAAKPKKKAAPPASSATSSEDGGYHVTITTEQEGVVLERLIGTTTLGNREAEHWERVCSAPCNTNVPGGSEYRVGGRDVRATPTFTIDPTRPSRRGSGAKCRSGWARASPRPAPCSRCWG